jgi:hypothetical protein
VASIGDRSGGTYTGFWWGGPREGDHWEDLGIYRKIILKWIFKKWAGKAWTVLLWLTKGDVRGAREGGNEPSGFIKCGEFVK